MVLTNPAILHSTADEVIDKRLDRIRRRHGATVVREFGVDPRISLENNKGKGRAQGVGRFVLSEGEEGETEDEDDFYQSSPRPGHGVVGDHQSCTSDHGYGYGHEQAQDIHGQPQVYGNPHFIGNAYLSRYVTKKRGGSFRSTPPPSSRESATPRKLLKHMPLLSGTTLNQSSEKFGTLHSASSSSSFITPPPSSFQDQGLQQIQKVGHAPSIKKFGRIAFKGKGGKKWEQRDYEEVINSLAKFG